LLAKELYPECSHLSKNSYQKYPEVLYQFTIHMDPGIFPLRLILPIFFFDVKMRPWFSDASVDSLLNPALKLGEEGMGRSNIQSPNKEGKRME
jgi:hypothetical protein